MEGWLVEKTQWVEISVWLRIAGMVPRASTLQGDEVVVKERDAWNPGIGDVQESVVMEF